MTTKVKKLKALLGSNGTSDPDLLKQLNAAHDGMKGNSAFAAPPFDIETFKSGIDKLTVLVTDAEDGGKKAISAKKKQRAEMIKQYTLLGHYVEAASNDDPAVFHTSGFVLSPATRTSPQPLPPASFEWIDRGPLTGQVVVKPKKLPKALSYDVHYGVEVNGVPPATWTTVTIPGSKKWTITNLTPGTNYAFQVRALGRLGYTDWSASTHFICG
ncbi:MAG TPA: fibronectin type III domain-containing protein [Terriglobia bacterium]|nr:fibronectin type III domain-containing protein [Terriglobia bacterium]